MAIQQIGIEKPTFRVVVYDDWTAPRHSDFGSAEALSETLRTAIPSLELANLSLNPLGEGQGSIIYTGEIALTPSQLSILGLS
jgi:hypothetical protein